MSEISDSIEAAALQPASTTIDGTTTNNRLLTEQIAADNHIAGKAALKKPRLGLITRKIARGSALGE